ncbi:MAG: YceI family protein [Gammaproteobacteria bacterium]|nr:YceI family protein [Gammaproteobacteria bacterium]
MLPRHGARTPVLAGTLLLALAAAPPVPAEEYDGIDAATSQLGFSYTQMGVSLDGRFARYAARLTFDPERPEAARVALEVQMASVDAGNEEGTSELAGAAWFDTARYPVARFESTALQRLPTGQFELRGQLSIKGRTRAVVVPVRFQAQGARGLLSGEFSINRMDFGVGEGEWADTSVVANPVRVRFAFSLTSGK